MFNCKQQLYTHLCCYGIRRVILFSFCGLVSVVTLILQPSLHFQNISLTSGLEGRLYGNHSFLYTSNIFANLYRKCSWTLKCHCLTTLLSCVCERKNIHGVHGVYMTVSVKEHPTTLPLIHQGVSEGSITPWRLLSFIMVYTELDMFTNLSSPQYHQGF